MPSPLEDLALARFEASGIPWERSKDLHIELLTAKQVQALNTGYQNLPALKINYLDHKGKPLKPWPSHPPFYRLRYLAAPSGFQAISGGKLPRYTQPIGTTCCAYFPSTQDWSFLDEPTEPLILTEGEFKAASSCFFGFPAVGLGGVHNWRSIPKGIEFLPELKDIAWVGRNVYICFDSDYTTNPAVCGALRELAEALLERGAFTHIVTLPTLITGAKTGLDDYLVAEGADNFRALLKTATPIGLAQVLFDYNKQYVYVRDPGLVVGVQNQKIAPGSFKEHLEATKTYHERILRPDGTFQNKAVSAAGTWLTWPLRHEALRMTYKPGQEREVDGELNSWPGWGLEPKAGSIAPFEKLVSHLFTGTEPEALEWFLSWLAYPLQHPGTKLFTAVIIHGTRHGTGKSLIGYTMKHIYGKNFTEISGADLHNSFNEWAAEKQFVMGDDVTGSNKRQEADALKKLITQQELRVNVKYIPSYVVPDCVNYFFTSNHPDAFFLEDDDRRYGVVEVLVEPLPEKFYQGYVEWVKDGGAAAVFAWLLKRDLKGFNPSAAAYKTAARARMISDIQSDLGGWVRELLSNPGRVLKLGEIVLRQDLLTSGELLQLYDPTGRTGTTANGLGRELRRAGVRQVNGGMPVSLKDGGSGRYYAIRNEAKWLQASHIKLADHLTWARGHVDGLKEKKVKF